MTKVTVVQDESGFYRILDEDGNDIKDITKFDLNLTHNNEPAYITKEVRVEVKNVSAETNYEFVCPACESVITIIPGPEAETIIEHLRKGDEEE
jgi:hypothetical protein